VATVLRDIARSDQAFRVGEINWSAKRSPRYFQMRGCAKRCWIGSRIAPRIIETGTESYRFRRTVEKRKKKSA
jgi:hypothetical protein